MILVKNIEEVMLNAENFKKDLLVDKHKRSTQFLKVYRSFSHWYYFKNDNVFIPSKFVGYKNMRLNSYLSEGDGADTQRVLQKYSDKIPKDTPQFEVFRKKLIAFSKKLGREIGAAVDGKGGIYLLKEEYIRLNRSNANSPARYEGGSIKITINKYERDPKLRAAAIKLHGFTCQCCEFNFEKYYGALGENFIEVHHITPLNKRNGKSKTDPITDLAVVCSNCHRMIHRNKQELKIQQLRKLIMKQRR